MTPVDLLFIAFSIDRLRMFRERSCKWIPEGFYILCVGKDSESLFLFAYESDANENRCGMVAATRSLP